MLVYVNSFNLEEWTKTLIPNELQRKTDMEEEGKKTQNPAQNQPTNKPQTPCLKRCISFFTHNYSCKNIIISESKTYNLQHKHLFNCIMVKNKQSKYEGSREA